MKKLIRLAAIIVFAAVFQACSLDNDPMEDGNHRLNQSAPAAAKVYTFRLSLGGDYVEQSEEPLMRADDTKNTYVGINVTCKSKSDADATSENYAYGVFTSKDNISIDLISGYTYDFEATILRDGTDTYFHNSQYDYTSPFGFYAEGDMTGDTKNYGSANIGLFNYNYLNEGITNLGYLPELSCGTAFIQVTDNKTVPEIAYYKFPRIDRFYGTETDIDPETLAKTDGTVNIDLYYKCFGITIDATNIPAGTYITCEDVTSRRESIHAYLVFPQNLELGPETEYTPIYKGVYSSADLTSENSITFDLQLTWHSGLNETKKIDTSIDVKPGYNKTLKISINGSPTTKYSGNININEKSSELEEDESEKEVSRDYN